LMKVESQPSACAACASPPRTGCSSGANTAVHPSHSMQVRIMVCPFFECGGYTSQWSSCRVCATHAPDPDRTHLDQGRQVWQSTVAICVGWFMSLLRG